MFKFASVAVLFSSIVADCPLPTYLGTIRHKEAAFLDALPNEKGDNDLFITSFNGFPFSKGSVSRIVNIGNILKRKENLSSIDAKTVNSGVTWPNGIKNVPADVFIPGSKSKRRVIGCGGFIVPTHGDGKCIVYDIVSERVVRHFPIARAGEGSFYHQATFYDVDGDGFHDLITAKASKSKQWGNKEISGALYWYRNPGQAAHGRHALWEEHVLLEGPDVHFELVDLDKDGIFEIVATQFWSESLTVSWLKEGGKFGGGPSQWQQRVVANDMGRLFNMTFVDLNNDGKEEIIITNHEDEALKSAVYAIEIPTQFKTQPWKQHVLLNDFPTLNEGRGQASPGGVVEIPMKNSKSSPIFAISGDGNQKAYIMCKKEKGGPWDWTRTELLDTGNTVGGIAVSDVTGDGYPELFVPSFEKGEIHVYTYAPPKP